MDQGFMAAHMESLPRTRTHWKVTLVFLDVARVSHSDMSSLSDRTSASSLIGSAARTIMGISLLASPSRYRATAFSMQATVLETTVGRIAMQRRTATSLSITA